MFSEALIKPEAGPGYRGLIEPGTIVLAKYPFGPVRRLERGICYEVCRPRGITGRVRYSMIFRCGYYRTFELEEIDSELQLTGLCCPEHKGRWFTYLDDLIRHWREGGFDAALTAKRPALQLVK